MKYLLSITLFFQLPYISLSQNPGPEISQQKCFSTSGHDSFHAIKKLNDGNYLASAYFTEKDYFLSNDTAKYFYLLKLDPNFNVIWKKPIPVYAYEIIILPNNEIILAGIAGYSSNSGNVISNIHGSPNNLSADLAVMKLDSTGQNVVWAYAYGSYSTEEFSDVLPLPDGGFLISGNTFGNTGDVPFNNNCYNPFATDALILKIDKNGIINWIDVLGGSDVDRSVGALIAISDSTYLVQVKFYSTDCDFINTIPYNTDSLNVKNSYVIYHINGNKLKQKNEQTGKNQYETVNSWINDGKIYTIGYNFARVAHVPQKPDHDNLEATVTTFDTSLNFLSQKVFGGSQFEVFVDHIYDSEGNHIFLGKTNTKDQTGDIPSAKGNDFDHWLLKTDKNFNIIWSRTIGGEGNNTTLRDRRYSEMLIENNSLLIAFEIIPPKILPSKDLNCGIYTPDLLDTSRGNSNAWLVRFDLSTGLNFLTKENNTISVFPNPTKGILTIHNSKPSYDYLSFILADLTGKKVMEHRFMDEEEVKVDLEEIKKGTYIFYILQKNEILISKKIVLDN